MSRIMVTGASGFIGSELVSRLVKDGHELHVLERYVTGRYSSDKKSQISTHYATLTDFPAIRKIVRDAQPDYVIHLAAISPFPVFVAQHSPTVLLPLY